MLLEMELCTLLLETLDTRMLGLPGRGRGVAGPRMGMVGLKKKGCFNSERLDGAPDTTSAPNGEDHEYNNHDSTLIPSMLYDEITLVFRFTSAILKTLLLNLNLFALNIILILQTNKALLLGYQHIPANCLLSNTIRMYLNPFPK
jgi:hypothetical protein